MENSKQKIGIPAKDLEKTVTVSFKKGNRTVISGNTKNKPPVSTSKKTPKKIITAIIPEQD